MKFWWRPLANANIVIEIILSMGKTIVQGERQTTREMRNEDDYPRGSGEVAFESRAIDHVPPSCFRCLVTAQKGAVKEINEICLTIYYY